MNDEMAAYWLDYWKEMIALVDSRGGWWAIVTEATGDAGRAVGTFTFGGVVLNADERFYFSPRGSEK